MWTCRNSEVCSIELQIIRARKKLHRGCEFRARCQDRFKWQRNGLHGSHAEEHAASSIGRYMRDVHQGRLPCGMNKLCVKSTCAGCVPDICAKDACHLIIAGMLVRDISSLRYPADGMPATAPQMWPKRPALRLQDSPSPIAQPRPASCRIARSNGREETPHSRAICSGTRPTPCRLSN